MLTSYLRARRSAAGRRTPPPQRNRGGRRTLDKGSSNSLEGTIQVSVGRISLKFQRDSGSVFTDNRQPTTRVARRYRIAFSTSDAYPSITFDTLSIWALASLHCFCSMASRTPGTVLTP